MQILLYYAMSLVGTPYRWGGDDPIAGFDCSGLVQELLSSAGIDPPGDQTAQGLHDYFEKKGSFNKYGMGALAFFGESAKKISHVAFCLDGYRMLEAGGGGSATTSLDAAIKQNAYVRIRPIKSRKDLQAIIMPYYINIGII